MESGTIFYHHLAMTGDGPVEATITASSDTKLANEPVLALDMAQSQPNTTAKSSSSFVAVAGQAGNAQDMNELPVDEQCTVAVIKASVHKEQPASTTDSNSTIKLRLIIIIITQ